MDNKKLIKRRDNNLKNILHLEELRNESTDYLLNFVRENKKNNSPEMVAAITELLNVLIHKDKER